MSKMPWMAFSPDDTPFVIRTSGLSLAPDAAALHGCTLPGKRLRSELIEHLVTGEPLTVVVPGRGSTRDPQRAFVRACAMLSDVVAECGVSAANIGLVVDAEALAPQAAWLVRRQALGRGPLHMRFSALSRSHWLQFWHLRMNRALRPVYAGSVTSRCGLLAAEDATTILPGVDLHAPGGSAWVAVEVDVSRYRDRRALDDGLRTAVERADQHHQNTRWPSAAMRHDAWLNRRLAIEVVGLGDVLRGRGLDPERHAAFDYLRHYLGRVARVIHGQSRRMAHRSGCLPALERIGPAHAWPGGRLRDGWQRRWRAAVETHAVRHRNLLVLQPWSLFPRTGPVDFRYAALAPLLRYADACSFPRPPSIAHWNVNEFIHFHRTACAAIQQRDASHQIAEHV